MTVLKEDTEEARSIVNSRLSNKMKAMEGFSYINIVNAQGEVRACSVPDNIGKIKVPDHEYFQKAMKGELNVSNIYVAITKL